MNQKKITYIVTAALSISAIILTSRYFSIKHTVQNCNETNFRPIELIQQIEVSFYLLKYIPNTAHQDIMITRYSPYLPVWFVSMNGKWESISGPLLENGEKPPPIQFTACESYINFFTAQIVSTFAK